MVGHWAMVSSELCVKYIKQHVEISMMAKPEPVGLQRVSWKKSVVAASSSLHSITLLFPVLKNYYYFIFSGSAVVR